MKNLILRGIVVGPVQTNCYFLKNKESGETLIVDPGAQEERIEAALASLESRPVGILLTHGHYDHICAANELRAHYNIPIYAPKAEEKLMSDPMANLSGAWSGKPYTVKADCWMEDGQEQVLAGFQVTAVYTPGHTSGSCCYWLKEEGVCMSGDTVFCGSCGRTDLPTGSMRQMKESLHRLFEVLPQETEIFPGHGEETDAAFEKAHNPYL